LTLKAKLERLRSEGEEKRRERNKLVNEKERALEGGRRKVQLLRDRLHRLSNLVEQVQDYMNGPNERKLADQVSAVRELKKRENARKVDINRLEERTREDENRLSEFAGKMKSLENIAELRKLEVEQKELREEVERYQKQLEALDQPGTARKKERLEREYSNWYAKVQTQRGR